MTPGELKIVRRKVPLRVGGSHGHRELGVGWSPDGQHGVLDRGEGRRSLHSKRFVAHVRLHVCRRCVDLAGVFHPVVVERVIREDRGCELTVLILHAGVVEFC